MSKAAVIERCDAPIEGVLAALDRLRRFSLKLLGRQLAPWVARREYRVALWGAFFIVFAFSLTALAPLWLLALGPIFLGVPHVMADLRYLWLRPGYHRKVWAYPLAVVPIGIAGYTGEVSWGLLSAAGVLCMARGSWTRRLAGFAFLIPLFVASLKHPGFSRLIFAHAHNLIALTLWWVWRPRVGKHHWAVLALFVVASVAIAGGAAEWIAAAWGISTEPGAALSMTRHNRSLAPFAMGQWGIRLVLFYAFAQSLHYAVWLRMVPEEDRCKSAPRPFVQSYRSLVKDMGRPLLFLGVLSTLAVAIWAVIDLAQARSGYLRFALFHGHLELAAGAWLWMERPRHTQQTPA